ncbi:hypothetical protein BDZ89DRAFT_1197837 [Hymenopellis radicata]|nr:hypothetical protein BDZ89DRAFT_1197837 [Hymenopellis radicata]
MISLSIEGEKKRCIGKSGLYRGSDHLAYSGYTRYTLLLIREFTDAHPATGLTFGFSLPAPPSSTLSDDHTAFSISYQVPEEPQFEMWEATEEDKLMYDDSDSDSDTDMEDIWDDEATAHWDILHRAAQGDTSIPTRVLDDALHFMDRLLRILAKKHSAFRAFAHDFSEAIFIRDKDDMAAVKAVLEKKGINWEYAKRCVGFHNRTGHKFRGHFDIWLSDEIVEIATLLDVKPSFRLPRLLATRIATSETFGILPIDTTLAEELGITTLPPVRVEGIPHHPPPTCSASCPPVASHAEYRKFKELINKPMFKKGSGRHPPHEAHKNINFTALAKFWNSEVNTQDRTITDTNQRLYYKIPAQLELHHKKTILWQSERSTLFLGENAVALKAFTDIVNSDENSMTTLPAIILDSGELDDTSQTVEDLSRDLQSFPMALQEENRRARAVNVRRVNLNDTFSSSAAAAAVNTAALRTGLWALDVRQQQ